jgi:hypothetical protein
MFDIEIIALAIMALIVVAFGAVAIAREVRHRKMDANATKIMER